MNSPADDCCHIKLAKKRINSTENRINKYYLKYKLGTINFGRKCLMIYFDNAATTRAADEVAERVRYMLLENFGNPSAQSMMGVRAENELNDARKIMAKAINAMPEEIYFTSGGTEDDNWYIRHGRGI